PTVVGEEDNVELEELKDKVKFLEQLQQISKISEESVSYLVGLMENDIDRPSVDLMINGVGKEYDVPITEELIQAVRSEYGGFDIDQAPAVYLADRINRFLEENAMVMADDIRKLDVKIHQLGDEDAIKAYLRFILELPQTNEPVPYSEVKRVLDKQAVSLRPILRMSTSQFIGAVSRQFSNDVEQRILYQTYLGNRNFELTTIRDIQKVLEGLPGAAGKEGLLLPPYLIKRGLADSFATSLSQAAESLETLRLMAQRFADFESFKADRTSAEMTESDDFIVRLLLKEAAEEYRSITERLTKGEITPEIALQLLPPPLTDELLADKRQQIAAIITENPYLDLAGEKVRIDIDAVNGDAIIETLQRLQEIAEEDYRIASGLYVISQERQLNVTPQTVDALIEEASQVDMSAKEFVDVAEEFESKDFKIKQNRAAID
ncbi:MAG: hypothetical protein K8I00_06225, partial [Candidatus Omnitrophica bacterium]|nr:hypothetical protein [Candidatus Omnitrophota bacterium]